MDKYVELIKLLEKIFGKGSVSRTIGTRTNVVRFPKGKQPIDPTRAELDVEGTAAKNPDLVQKIENSIEDRMGDITKMNDQELLTYTANVRRLANFKEPPPLPEADVIKFGSGEEIKGKGLETLIEKQGTRFPPTTDIGKLEATGKRLEKLSEDFAKEFDPTSAAKLEAERLAMIQRQYEGKGYAGGVFGPSGMYRAVARDFLLDQHAKGKIKLDADTLRNLEERNYLSGGQPLMYADPIRVMRYHYGDDVFEKIPLDKIPTGARSEIIEVMSKVEAPPIKTEAPKTPGGYLTPGEYRANIEEMQRIEDAIKRRESRFADMTEEEIQNELAQYGAKRSSFEMGLEQDYPEEFAKYKKPKDIEEPEEKAEGGIIGYADRSNYFIGGFIRPLLSRLTNAISGVVSPVQPVVPEIPLTLIERYNKYLSQSTPGASDEFYNQYKKNLENKAEGGRIGYKGGKRVLTDIDKLIEQLNKKTKGKKSMESVNPKTGEVTLPKKPIRRAEEPTGTTVMDPEPEIVDEKSITKTQEKTNVQKYDKDIAKAANNIFPDYNDPKIAADQIVDSYAQIKFGLEDASSLSSEEQMKLYNQAYNYVMDYNRGAFKLTAPVTSKEVDLEKEMNMVLNQYDKSMFIKDQQGMVDVSNPENVKRMALLLKENHPELYKRLEGLGSQLDEIENFDVTGRKPNADGGIAGLL